MSNLDYYQYYGQNSVEDQIVQNIVSFIDYGLLELGAYFNIFKGQTDYLGNNVSRYRTVDQPGIEVGKVWEGLKHNVIWETGVNLKPTGLTSPIGISGIYVNDVFYPNGSTVIGNGYYFDYSLNRVIFNNKIASASKVEVEHSLRHINVYSTDTNFYRDAIAFYNDRNNFFVSGSGIDNTNPRSRVYLPSIFIYLKNLGSSPVEIGSRAKYVEAEIEFDIFTQSSQDRKRLTDICFWLEEKSIGTFNVNNAPKPLSISGTLNSNRLLYNDLINQYYYRTCRFGDNFTITRNTNLVLPIQNVTVRGTFEIPLYP
jgi:hypothetical protein